MLSRHSAVFESRRVFWSHVCVSNVVLLDMIESLFLGFKFALMLSFGIVV